MILSQAMHQTLEKSSWIRQMFEQGQKLKAQHGAENVFDFSLGNPILEPPPQFRESLIQLLQSDELGKHRYMPNAGFPETRSYVAQSLEQEWQLPFTQDHIVMTVGAGGAMNVICKTLLDPGSEVIALAPYFVEYGAYASNHGGKLVVVSTDDQFQPDLDAIEQAITPKTKIIIVNSPNNPTGVIYTQETLNALGALLQKKEQEFGHPIFLVSDEPYRHLLFDGSKTSSVFLAHGNSLMATSHSKDLGLAGERIGYIATHPQHPEASLIQEGLCLSNRTLGFVNAPALMQRVLPHLHQARVDIQVYERLRDIIYPAMKEIGYDVVKPEGSFFMFPKSPLEDDVAFVKAALEYNILLVPGTGFGKPGYFRLAFCCETSTLEKAIPLLKKLYESVKK